MSTKTPKTISRSKILDRALEMTGRRLPRLMDVLADLGRSTGYGYQIWSNQDEYYRDLSAVIASVSWVRGDRANEHAIEIAVRHCDHRDLTPRFAELVKFAEDEIWSAADVFWDAFSWEDEAPDV